MLIPLSTTEVRWFFQGFIPTEVQDWFDGFAKPIVQPVRTDLYLPGLDASIGIKLREGNLEVKHRTAVHGVVDFSRNVSGLVESWVKWGFEVQDENLPWVRVQKNRQIFYFTVSDQGEVHLNDQDILPEQGGGVEVASVKLNDLDWWTVGLEVIGPVDKQLDVLNIHGATLFNNLVNYSLQIESSSAYPKFLQSVG